MKKIILFTLMIFSLSTIIISCSKTSGISVSDTYNNVVPVGFLTLENATDSGTVSNVSYTKSGYTAIIQQNYSKDSSAIDSLKFIFENVASKIYVDTLVIAAPTPTAATSVSSYPMLVTKYFNFTIGSDSLLVTGQTYSVVASVYTNKGNSQTATFSNLFKW